MFNRQRLVELFQQRALRRGEFTLASGKTSTYYIDKMQITLDGEGLRLVCEGLLELLADINCDAVGGMTIGADPIVGGMLALAQDRGKSIQGFLVRKQPKGHGTRQYIEGPLQPGQTVVIIEDVVTTGGSSTAAVQRVREFGCRVAEVLAVIDRLEGGAAAFAELNVPYRALLTIENLGVARNSG